MASRDNIPDLSTAAKYNVIVAPASRFAGEFASVVEGVSMTKVVERGAIMFAEEVANRRDIKGWRHYWDTSDGSPEVALALLYAEKSLPLDETRQAICDLIWAHERFFFEREGRQLKPKRRNIEVLWPHITMGRLTEHWRNKKSQDQWATGAMMQDILKKAGLRAPQWGPAHD